MARPLRIAPPGTVLHVYARGNARMDIFVDESDHRAFLDILGEAVSRYRLACLAYCLMPNHYHLLVETRDTRLSAGMRQINGCFAQTWNRRRSRTGHVFGGRFKSQIVQTQSYLLTLVRYVALNPVRAGLVAQAAQWPWSSYAALVGTAAPPTVLDVEGLLRYVGTGRAQVLAQLRSLIERPEDRIDLDVARQVRTAHQAIGDAGFVRRFEPWPRTGHRRQGGPERGGARPPLPDLLARHPRPDRDRSIIRACREHGYRQADVARALRLHPSVVSRILGPVATQTGTALPSATSPPEEAPPTV